MNCLKSGINERFSYPKNLGDSNDEVGKEYDRYNVEKYEPCPSDVVSGISRAYSQLGDFKVVPRFIAGILFKPQLKKG